MTMSTCRRGSSGSWKFHATRPRFAMYSSRKSNTSSAPTGSRETSPISSQRGCRPPQVLPRPSHRDVDVDRAAHGAVQRDRVAADHRVANVSRPEGVADLLQHGHGEVVYTHIYRGLRGTAIARAHRRRTGPTPAPRAVPGVRAPAGRPGAAWRPNDNRTFRVGEQHSPRGSRARPPMTPHLALEHECLPRLAESTSGADSRTGRPGRAGVRISVVLGAEPVDRG